jgi:DNA polymerase III delta prime subunit
MTLGELPHLLFYGPAGTGMFILKIFNMNFIILFSGKTSTILALAKQMYTPAEMRGCVLEVN